MFAVRSTRFTISCIALSLWIISTASHGLESNPDRPEPDHLHMKFRNHSSEEEIGTSLNSIQKESIFAVRDGKLPLEAVEEPTEELRQRISTTQATKKRSVDMNETMNNSISTDLSMDILNVGGATNSSNSTNLDVSVIRNARDNYGGRRGAFCQKHPDCRHDQLICFRNRCRPSLDCTLVKCTTSTKPPETSTIALPVDACKALNLPGVSLKSGNGGSVNIVVHGGENTISAGGGGGGGASIRNK